MGGTHLSPTIKIRRNVIIKTKSTIPYKNEMTLENERETFPIYNQRLAGFLMMRGYPLINMSPNEKFITKNVFYFYDTPKIRKTMKNYFGKSE